MRDIPVGNGSLLVTFDEYYQIRDVYFPHVGKENHTEGHACRFGVWTDNKFSWTGDESWQRVLKYLPETLVTDVQLKNDLLAIEIVSNDLVLSHANLFLRRVTVKNAAQDKREIRLFLHQDFYISESEVGDTAFFEPDTFSIVHYKANRYFLINTAPRFSQFATGRKGLPNREGTWRDAEDGILAGGAITEGAVDSTVGLSFNLQPGESAEFYYWIAAGQTLAEVTKLNRLINQNSPQRLFADTENYWRAWVNKNNIDFKDLCPEIIELFKRSLLVIRTQIDNGGAILAANDSDVTLRATDHYSYLWTRDGALVAHALDLSGYSFLTRSFFELCARIIHENGYFLQKYNPDGSLASGWHAAWDAHKQEKLVPIQEDETALVLWALWQHYDRFRDIEFVRRHYHGLIVKAADFMTSFRDQATSLPALSWNLWEDRRGIHTFTCGTVVGGLEAAANFARLFGESERETKYQTAADEIRRAMRQHLYSPSLGRFIRALMPDETNGFYADTTIDSSLWGAFYFGAFAADDELVRNTMQSIETNLWAKTEIGGVARYESDGYMTISTDYKNIPGNPWFISTLWLADYYIAAAKTKPDLDKALRLLEWTARKALPSGVLAEQVNPLNGAPVSVSPLTWSHSSFVATVMNYLHKCCNLQT